MSYRSHLTTRLTGLLSTKVTQKAMRLFSLCAFVATSLMASTVSALAETGGQTINTRLQEWNGFFNNGGRFALNFFMLLGIGVAGFGIMEMKRAGDANNQGRDSHKSGLIKLLCGGGLASLTGLISLASGTLLGSGGGNGNMSVGTANFGG